jgi:hypothetical protein
MIHDPALVEAAARAICRDYGTDPDDKTQAGLHYWKLYTYRALSILDAIMPLIEEHMLQEKKKK